MYKGFNVKLNQDDLAFISKLKSERDRTTLIDNSVQSRSISAMAKEAIHTTGVSQLIHKGLDLYLNAEAVLDGTRIQDDWFPTVDAQVFISHSHQDLELATELAGWLWNNFRVESFIDSYVWDYADRLLRQIDNKYCYNKENGTYNYDMRNFSTSHVHMMLATALTKMIDKTECLLFLNTPNSVPSEGIKTQTYSPWIYHEIATTKIIRETLPKRGFVKEAERDLQKSQQTKPFEVSHDLDLKNLITLDKIIFEKLVATNLTSSDDALDWLYENVKPTEKTTYQIFIK